MIKRELYNDLLVWKVKPDRKPLILRGARQVGKTTLVKSFSQEFDYFISLNLEVKKDQSIFIENESIDKIITSLYFKNKIPSNPEKKVLLFIDEIQNSPNAINLLRYFYEEHNYVHVIAAGSLLESILDNKISFPVGRVEYLVLRPFSFHEYLVAKEMDHALKALETVPIPDYAHQVLKEAFKEYVLIGGMPEVVMSYVEYADLVKVGDIYQSLITGYLDDVEKYAKSTVQVNIIRHVIESVMRLAGERIKFEGFGASNYKSKDIAEAMRMLEKTFLIRLMYPTTMLQKPAIENKRKSPKLQLLDTGLLNHFAHIQGELFTSDSIDSVFEGKVAEHITGQELMTLNKQPLVRNLFWVKEKKQSNAEIDYIVFHESEIHPIEVKLGKTGRLRSLSEYMDLSPSKIAVRVYSGELRVDEVKTLKGRPYYLLNLPFYLVHKIYDYLNWVKNKISTQH